MYTNFDMVKPRQRRFEVPNGFIAVSSVSRHRNGVAGDGFYEVRFTDEDREFIGIVADSSFLSPDDVCAGAHVYVVGAGEPGVTMRGHDYYGDALVRAVNVQIRAWNNANGWKIEKSDLITKGKI